MSASERLFGPTMITLLFISLAIITTFAAEDGESAEVKVIEMDIPPNYYRHMVLEGYEKEGDNLHLTIIPLVDRESDVPPRRFHFFIVEAYIANNFNMYTNDVLNQKAIYSQYDVVDRVNKDIVNDRDGEIFLVIDNPYMDGDDYDLFNTTVRIRIDYYVDHVEEETGFQFLGSTISIGLAIFLVVDVIAIVVMVVTTMIVIHRMKKKSTDSNSFYTPAGEYYYAYLGPDGSKYYFTPQQYAELYKSTGMAGYQYLGQSATIGGVPKHTAKPAAPVAQMTSLQPVSMEALPVAVPTDMEYSQPLTPEAYGGEQYQYVQDSPVQ
ncbi:MAG: hypothetical protein ACMUIG_06280 [Thermoplasmatota archaeon]